MPAGSEELTRAREKEIIDACARLYEKLPYAKITIGAISEETSFTRTSVYNYFRTKEEIFLALLEREYEAWTADLTALAGERFPAEEFPARFAEALEKRGRMLKLLSMNLYDMEAGSGMEALISFKKAYARSIKAVTACLRAHYAGVSDEDAQRFVYAFYPFLFGVYPYTRATDKQKEAMDRAGVVYRPLTVREITLSFTEALVADLKRKQGE